MLTDKANKFLEMRGLDPELASRLGFSSEKKGGVGEEISIPYVVDERVINHKYRTLASKDFRQDPGKPQVFWNQDCLLDQTLAHEPMIITEGEFDAMAAMQAGFMRVMSVPGGAKDKPVTDGSKAYAYIEAVRPLLDAVGEFILAVDNDGPGTNLLNDLAIRLGQHRVKFIRYPKGCKDLNDALRLYGPRGVVEALRTAAPIEIEGLYDIDTLPPHEHQQAYSTGFKALDPHFKVRMGDLSVWTGCPGHGKTTFNNFLTYGLAKEHGFKILLASFEQKPQDHLPALMNLYLGFPARDQRTQALACSDVEYAAARQFIRDHYKFMYIPENSRKQHDVDWMLDLITVSVKRDGVKIVVIDPWNEIEHNKSFDQSLTEYTGWAIKEIKRAASRLNVHIMIVAHPAKDKYTQAPGLYSISDSAHWANKPDVGGVIWRPNAEHDIAEVSITKSRYQDQIGKPGKIRVRYQPAQRIYEQIAWPVEVEEP